MATISTTGSIAHLPESEVLPLTRGRSFYMSRPWLLAIERLRGDQVSYLTSRGDDGRLLGLLPVYSQQTVTAGGAYDVYARLLAPSGGAFLEHDWSPTLVLGQNAAFSGEFLIDTDMSPATEQTVLLGLIEGAETARPQTRSPSLAALYLNESGTRQLTGLGRYQPSITCGVDSDIAVAWSSWDDYLAHLGKKATMVRRERSAFQAAGYTVTVEPLREHLDASTALFSNLQRKYGDNSSVEARARYLQIIVEELDLSTRLFVMRRGADVVGVCLAFEWDGALYIRQFGLDYDQTAKAFEYFNVTIYEPILYAMTHGLHRVHFGRSTYTGRMLRGANAKPLMGMCVSAAAGAPGEDTVFQQWSDQRLKVITAGSHAQITDAFREE